MPSPFSGQVVSIFGAAGGIGQAIARRFAQQGARLFLNDVLPNVVEQSERLRAETGAEVFGRVLDALDAQQVAEHAADLLQRFGGCDHVVHAIAVGSGKYGEPFWMVSPSDWENVWRVNVMTAVHVAHAFAPQMSRRHSGSFVFLSSVAGQFGSPTDPPYSASKAALINFAQCVARDLAPDNVRANVVAPGMVRTQLNRAVWAAWNARQTAETKKSYEQWAAAKIARTTPLNRWQEPDDVAAAVVFLASPDARNITGQTINVDGGQIMHS